MCVALMGLQTNGKSGVHLEQASMAGPGLVAGLGKISVGSVGGCIDELVGHPPLEVEFMLATVFTSRWRWVAIHPQISSWSETFSIVCDDAHWKRLGLGKHFKSSLRKKKWAKNHQPFP